MITPTYTPAIGSWAWMCCALQDGMRVRLKTWLGREDYIYLERRKIKNQLGEVCFFTDPYYAGVWELYEEPQEPLTLEPHSFLWAYAKAMAGNLNLRPVREWSVGEPSTISYKILYGVIVCAADPTRPLNFSPEQLAARWEVL